MTNSSALGLGSRIIVLCMVAVGIAALAVFVANYMGFGLYPGLAAGTILGLLLALVGVKWVNRPIVDAIKTTESFIATGDESVLLDGNASDELGTLLTTFSHAATKVASGRRFAENAVKSLCNPVFVTDAKGKIVVATQAFLDLVDKPLTQVIGFPDSQVLWADSTDSLAGAVLDGGSACADRTDTFVMSNGEELTLRIFSSRVVNDAGEGVGAIVSILNMHTLIEQQAEMEEQQKKAMSVGKEVSVLAGRVASASEELSAAADEQASGAQRQKVQTDAVATTMEKMTTTVLEVAQNASATSSAASEANDSAKEGVTMVNRAMTAIKGVSDSADELAEMVHQLDEQSSQIGEIISVINDIADQTNLLALNAAIEAARAGEAGRGFAVVADEVRKLAEKTMVATKEVESAINTIQQRSKLAMQSMGETGKQVEVSTEMANKAGKALQSIMEAIENMVLRATQIATAAEEQSAATEEINESIDNIAQVAAESDEGAGQTAAATRDLAELSQQLLSVAMQFSGKEQDTSKLRASENEMKGVLPKLLQEFVQENYGDEIYNIMQEELGDPVFLPTTSYPDQVFVQMAEVVARETGESLHDVFQAVGRFTMGAFVRMYPRYIKDDDLKTFYLRMNDLHAQLTKDHPGIQPPNFTYEDKGDVLFMNYRSNRGLFDYFEGILNGAAEFKGEAVEIVVKPFDSTTARAEIKFL